MVQGDSPATGGLHRAPKEPVVRKENSVTQSNREAGTLRIWKGNGENEAEGSQL